MFSIADSDTGYHENEVDIHTDALDGMVVVTEVVVGSTQRSEGVLCQPNPNICTQESVVIEDTDQNTQQSMFKTGNKRRRPALKSTYDRLNTITSKKIDQLTRSENNEDELMDIKRKRFKLEESMAKKTEELLEMQTRYFEGKNRREEEIHQRQLQMFDRTMEKNI